MTTRCSVCSEETVEAGHTETKKHQINAGLDQLTQYKKLFTENRDNIMVTCTACPTEYNAEPLWSNKDLSRLEVSMKPMEEIKFNFTIRNDNPHEIAFDGVAMLNNRKLNFKLNNDSVLFGTSDHRIPPTQSFEQEVSITFKDNIIGMYQMPVNFFFTSRETNTNTIIFKHLIVYVETREKEHFDVSTPFTQEVVFADVILSSPSKRVQDSQYPIPSKDHKTVFIHHLKTDCDSLTDEQKTLAENIRNVLETGPTQDNYIQYFHHLLWYEEATVAQSLKKYNMSGVTLLLRNTRTKSYALRVPGLAEKRPSLMIGDLVHVRPHGQTAILFECAITDIEDNYALIGKFCDMFHPKRGDGYYSPNAKFDVRFFMSRVPMERMHIAVASVDYTDAICKIYPKKSVSPTIKPIAEHTFFNEQVAANPEQRAVVEHVVAGCSGGAPYLLFGPPGTGKTVTIVEAILQLVRDPTNSILVCTDSNMAADHVASKLVQYKDRFPNDEDFILRASSKHRVGWESMPACLAPHSNGTDRLSYYPVPLTEFLGYRIVVTTLIHAAKYGSELMKSDHLRTTTHVFIDEAAQASEPAALVPVCGLLAPAGALVLAGDPRQLGPVCISREAKDRGLGISLMERLKNTCPLYSDENPDPNYFMMLKKNFRSHVDILAIPSELFYQGKLEALAQPDPISDKDILGEREKSRAIVFHGVLSSEQRMGRSPSFYNDMELEMVQTYVLALVRQHNVPQQDIGVVSPYIRQVSKIKAWLKAAWLRNIEVGTVEALQGKEKRVVIVSCVRANCNLFAHDAKFRLGFLVDPKRFNVAMTRAKAKLIVIGNPLCLRKDDRWTKYMQKCRDLGTYTGYDCGPEESDADRDRVLDQIAPMMTAMVNAVQRLTL